MSEIQNDIEEKPNDIDPPEGVPPSGGEEPPKPKRAIGRPRETEEMKVERRLRTRNPDIQPVGRPKWNPNSIHNSVETARDYHREY